MNELLKTIPTSSGIYKMLDENNTIIYIGKSKNLKSRVNSYFKATKSGKTLMLVNEVKNISFITTKTELEAFILEHNLIKKYSPKYNILLKDDKTYPYIEYVTKPFPQLKIVRYHTHLDKKYLYGPFPNVYAARRIVNLLNRLYPLKKCAGLPKDVCLYYHIKECLGYCKYDISPNKIDNINKEIIAFFEGDNKVIKNKIKNEIKSHSDNLNFELAQELKEELSYIDIVLDKQNVEIKDKVSKDIIGLSKEEDYLGINILFIRNGKLLGSHFNTISIINNNYDSLNQYLYNFYLKHEVPKEILLSSFYKKHILEDIFNSKILYPLKGGKKRLLDLAIENAKINLKNSFINIKQKENITIHANNKLSQLLGIKINKIESFDNSHLFGENYVGAMSVFVNGIPNKNKYRKFKLKLNKSNDTEAMREVIYRRYNKAIIEDEVLPDLIIVDGGKAQINVTKKELANLGLSIKIIGLAKDDNHKTNKIIHGDTLNEIQIKDDHLFLYLKQIQDETHRFVVNYHRNLKNKLNSKSFLDNINGIGEKRKIQLLKKYKTINNIKKASDTELQEILPKNVIINLRERFDMQDD